MVENFPSASTEEHCDGSRVESPQSVQCGRHASSLYSIVWGVRHSMQTSDWKNLVGRSHSDRRQVLLRHLRGRLRRPPQRLRWWHRAGDNNKSLTHDSRVAHPQLASKHLSVPEVGAVGDGRSLRSRCGGVWRANTITTIVSRFTRLQGEMGVLINRNLDMLDKVGC